MDWLTALLIVAGFVIVILLLNKKLSELNSQNSSKELLEVIRLLQDGSKQDRLTLLNTLQKNTDSLNQRLDHAAQVISSVQRNIGEMSEIGRGMKELQDFLKSPKLRGNMGEQIMRDLLAQMLPKNSYQMQYSFRSGEKVDAAIKTSAGIIPVDAKFPMENFRKLTDSAKDEERAVFLKLFERDVKGHVDAIAKKYIVTDEGTIDYALMYIPSEAVYYEAVNNPKLFEYASDKRVLPVSPTTFYAYLRVILMSLEGQKIEMETAKIFSTLRAIQKDYEKTYGSLTLLQKHLTNAHNTMDTVFDGYTSLGQKITSTRNISHKESPQIST